MVVLRKVAARLPVPWQTELRRIYCGIMIRRGKFETNEPEDKILDHFIHPGDWVIDIGANVGHYTKRFSELVGPKGRVLAFEPVPLTFSLLSANVQLFAYKNVTLVNAAVSDKLSVVGMTIPTFATGLTNYYGAEISNSADDLLSVLTMPLDSLCIDRHISVVKIDTEGHEAFVLAGMRNLIEASHPVLIIETHSRNLISDLAASGYNVEKLPGSPNYLFTPKFSILSESREAFVKL